VCCGATPANAGSILIGTFAFDIFLPAAEDPAGVGVNTFTVTNLTDLLGAPAVLSALTVTHSSPSVISPADLPDVDGGLNTQGPFFAADLEFTSATLTGTIGVGSFLLPEGLFVLDSSNFLVTLLPDAGFSILTPGQLVAIELTGELVAVVPEPSTGLPVVVGSIVLLVLWRGQALRAAT
jgi:hypothetical protein